MKLPVQSFLKAETGRSPHGERGLKCKMTAWFSFRDEVAPPTGSVD